MMASQPLTDNLLTTFKDSWNTQEFLTSFYSLANSEDRENPLTVFVKWDEWAFKIIQWDVDCQCFRVLDHKNIGLHINNKGMFTIGTKYSPNKDIKDNVSQCTSWKGFWWQAWNTWWRTISYLNISGAQIGKNKLMNSNCYKYPVIFLDSDEEIPFFPPKSEIDTLTEESLRISSRNTYWDKRLGKFVGQKHWTVEGDKRHKFIRTYGDYCRIMNLSCKGKTQEINK